MIVTHLVIPSQIGDTSSCESTGESDPKMWEHFALSKITLVGWVHSHPLYDSFFSSVDLHSQYQYQNELNQYFGLVYSGIKDSTHGFTLSDAGLRSVDQCILNPYDIEGNLLDINKPHETHDISPGVLYKNIDNQIKLVNSQIIVKDLRFIDTDL